MVQQILLYTLTFISGLFFGSFFNLVSDRIVKGKSIITGRSKCDFCKKELLPKHLIPLVSFALQKGRCAFCNKKLSWYYPLSEILTGIAFVGVAYFSGLFTELTTTGVISFSYLAAVASFYIVLFLTDIKYKLLPNKVVYPAIFFVLGFLVLNTTIFLWLFYNQLKNDSFGIYLLQAGYFQQQVIMIVRSFAALIISSLGIGVFFWFLVFITKGRGMGQGDIRLGILIGLFNGFPLNIVAIFTAFVVGAVYSIIMIAFRKKSLKDTIAFGPFLILGSVISFIWGSALLDMYLNLF